METHLDELREEAHGPQGQPLPSPPPTDSGPPLCFPCRHLRPPETKHYLSLYCCKIIIWNFFHTHLVYMGYNLSTVFTNINTIHYIKRNTNTCRSKTVASWEQKYFLQSVIKLPVLHTSIYRRHNAISNEQYHTSTWAPLSTHLHPYANTPTDLLLHSLTFPCSLRWCDFHFHATTTFCFD